MPSPTLRPRRPTAVLKGALSGDALTQAVDTGQTIGCTRPDESVVTLPRYATVRLVRSDLHVVSPLFEVHATTSGPAIDDGTAPTGCDANGVYAYSVVMSLVLWPGTPYQVSTGDFRTYQGHGGVSGSASGSWSCTLPVEEWADRYAPVAGDGTPLYDTVYGRPYPNWRASGQADGAPAQETDLYECLVVGETATLTATAFGLTLTLSSSVPQPWAMHYGPMLSAYLASAGGYSTDTGAYYSGSNAAIATYEPPGDATGFDATGDPWTYSATDSYVLPDGTHSGVWTWSSGTGNRASVSSAGAFGYCGCDAEVFGDRLWAMSLRCQDVGSSPLSEGLEVQSLTGYDATLAVPGHLDQDFRQVLYDYRALRYPEPDEDPVQLARHQGGDQGALYASWALDGGDDALDWRAPWQLYPWRAARISLDATTPAIPLVASSFAGQSGATVSGDGTSVTIALPAS